MEVCEMNHSADRMIDVAFMQLLQFSCIRNAFRNVFLGLNLALVSSTLKHFKYLYLNDYKAIESIFSSLDSII